MHVNLEAAGLNINLEEVFIWYFEQKGVENVERFIGVDGGVKVGMDLQNPTVPIPLLQAMAQNMQNKNVENEQPKDVLEKVIKESEVK